MPEHNATEYAYDLRSNLVSTCLIPKERTGLHCDTGQGDIKSTQTYFEASTVWACANLANCNKVKTETNPRDAMTEYDWDADGFLNWVQGPLIGTQQSRTDLDYKTYAIGGGDIKFLWHKTERVAADKPSIVTLYDYNPTKKYALKSAIVDPTGKAITTCFDYDDLGRLTSVTDPRAGACQ
jgi:YD repeat-containing protein